MVGSGMSYDFANGIGGGGGRVCARVGRVEGAGINGRYRIGKGRKGTLLGLKGAEK